MGARPGDDQQQLTWQEGGGAECHDHEELLGRCEDVWVHGADHVEVGHGCWDEPAQHVAHLQGLQGATACRGDGRQQLAVGVNAAAAHGELTWQ
jgi:hypothetical protein